MTFLQVADNFRTYVCQHVFDNSRPITLIAREEDGDFMCLCGCAFNEGDPVRVVGFGHLKPRLKMLWDRSFPERGVELQLIDGKWIEVPLSE